MRHPNQELVTFSELPSMSPCWRFQSTNTECVQALGSLPLSTSDVMGAESQPLCGPSVNTWAGNHKWIPGPLRYGKGCESFINKTCDTWISLVAQMVKHLPEITMRETWVRSLEKEMATHSSVLAWEIPWTEEPGRLQSMRLQESDTTE